MGKQNLNKKDKIATDPAEKISKILEASVKKNKGTVDHSDLKAGLIQKNKYLEALGAKQKDYDILFTGIESTDKRWVRWAKEKKDYGITEVDTWDFDSTFVIYLYSQLKKFMEYADNFVDLSSSHNAFKVKKTPEEIKAEKAKLEAKAKKSKSNKKKDIKIDLYKHYTIRKAILEILDACEAYLKFHYVEEGEIYGAKNPPNYKKVYERERKLSEKVTCAIQLFSYIWEAIWW